MFNVVGLLGARVLLFDRLARRSERTVRVTLLAERQRSGRPQADPSPTARPRTHAPDPPAARPSARTVEDALARADSILSRPPAAASPAPP